MSYFKISVSNHWNSFHAQGRHELLLGMGAGQAKCYHGELIEAESCKPLVKYGSESYKNLSNVLISDGQIMKCAPYLVNFQ